MEVLLVVGGFDVDGGAEARLVNKDVNKIGRASCRERV